MLRQMLSEFEPEQCLEMRNYKYSLIEIFIIFWQMELVFFFVFCFLFFVLCWYIQFILSFGCVTIVNREMKSVSAI